MIRRSRFMFHILTWQYWQQRYVALFSALNPCTENCLIRLTNTSHEDEKFRTKIDVKFDNAERRRDQSKDSHPLNNITLNPPHCGTILNLVEECVYLEYTFQPHRVFVVSIHTYKPCHIPLNCRCLITKSDYQRPTIPQHIWHVQIPHLAGMSNLLRYGKFQW